MCKNKYQYLNDIGIIVSVHDGIVTIKGLLNVANGEMVTFCVTKDVLEHGLILNLEKNKVSSIVLSNDDKLKPGQFVIRTYQLMSVPTGNSLLGRVVNPLGLPIDGKGNINTKSKNFIETRAPSIISRTSVNNSLETGIKIVDTLVPIGHGQRELIIGDSKTGKTSIALDAIINQAGKDTICIYVAIGQKKIFSCTHS